VAREKKFEEESTVLCMRVPKSRKNEIKSLVDGKLKEFEKTKKDEIKR
jgi:hypothetical protein